MRLRDLRYRCRVIEQSVRHRRLASAEELAAARPGGAENALRGGDGLLRWYGHLCGYIERMDSAGPQRRAADAALLAALAELPQDLPLTITPGPDGRPLPLRVYPKSLIVLLDCAVRTEILKALSLRVEALRLTPAAQFGPGHASDLDRFARELGRQLLMFAWIATTPGCGLPYPEDADPEPDPPASLQALDPWDLWQVHRAWHEVNAGRLGMMDQLVRPPAQGQRQGGTDWSVLYATVAETHHADARRMLRDRSLAAVLASVRLGHPEPVPARRGAPAEVAA